MHVYCNRSTLLLIVLSFVIEGYAQEQEFDFKRIAGPESGTSFGSVNAILQDRVGFMWLATENDLFRYDGYSFDAFQLAEKNSGKSTSLFSRARGITIVQDSSGVLWIGSRARGSTIVQDSSGVLWIGTRGAGFARFDPVTEQFRYYRNNPEESASLIHDEVWDLFVDSEGMIWIGTSGGLDRFEPETEEFTHFRNDPADPASLVSDVVTEIYEDRSGTLWIGTWRGLDRFDRATEQFTHYRHDPNDITSLNSNDVTSIFQDHSGALWIGTLNGLNRFEPATESFSRYLHEASDPNSPGHNEVEVVYETHEGLLLIGLRDGLDLMDPVTGRLAHFRHDPNNLNVSSDNRIRTLYVDRSGLVWIGKASGLERVTQNKSGLFARTLGLADSDVSEDFLSGTQMSLLEDREERLWIGTYENGLGRYDPSVREFTHYRHDPNNLKSLSSNEIRTIIEDDSGILWIATDGGGLNRFDPATEQFTHYRHDSDIPNSLSNDYISAIHEGHAGTFWIELNSGGGLDHFDPATGWFTHYRHEPGNPGSLSDNQVNAVYTSPRGFIRVLTGAGGFDRFDPSTGNFTPYRHDPENPNSLSSDRISSLHEDGSGLLWIATRDGGLNRFDPETERFTHYRYDPEDPNSLSSNRVEDLYEDKAGRLWVVMLEGIDLMDRETGSLTHYPARHGVVPNCDIKKNYLCEVCNILEDDRGSLWLDTAGGLSQFNPEIGTVRHYVAAGLNSICWPGIFLRTSRGEFYLNGRDSGFVIFQPGRFYIPSVVLTSFAVYGAPLQFERTFPFVEDIRLTYDRNFFSFEFAVLDFTDPGQNQFEYTLEGFDEAWIENGTRNFASYTNVPPGDYVFRVRGASSSGVWNEYGASLLITITPPFWQTGWFYALCVFIGLSFVGLIGYIVRAEQVKRQARTLQFQVTERTRELAQSLQSLKQTQAQLIQSEKMASLGQLTAGIAHEIKNPLNFVNNFAGLNEELIEELESGLEEDEAREIIQILKINEAKIREHGRRADRIVQSMMRHAGGTTGERQRIQLNAFVKDYLNLAHHGLQARHPEFRVSIEQEYDPGVGEVEVVPQEIGQVLTNLFNNAFEAMIEKGDKDNEYQAYLEVATIRKDSTAEIRVCDNGPGIPPDIRDKIFEPFFTTKPTGSGTGLGLSLSYDIVTKGHGGRLELGSEAGEGATFVVTLIL